MVDPIVLSAAWFEAATDARLWPRALQQVAESVGGTMAMLFSWDISRGCQLESPSWNVSQEADRLYRDHYAALDPRRRAIVGWPVGRLFVDADHFDADVIRRDPFWQEFLIPVGAGHVAAIRLRDDAERLDVLSIHHPMARGPIAPEARSHLQALAPDLMRAAAAHYRLDHFRRRGVIAEAAFELLVDATLVVAADGRILLANTRAEALLRRAEVLRSTQGRLVARDSRTAAVLEWAIGAATRKRATGRSLSVAREDGQQPYRLIVTPLPTLDGPTAAVVTIADPARRPAAPAERLRELFGLTAAEARLAHILADGRNLDEAAEVLGIGRETAKKQLQGVFHKLEVSRQAQLVAILATLQSFALEPNDRP